MIEGKLESKKLSGKKQPGVTKKNILTFTLQMNPKIQSEEKIITQAVECSLRFFKNSQNGQIVYLKNSNDKKGNLPAQKFIYLFSLDVLDSKEKGKFYVIRKPSQKLYFCVPKFQTMQKSSGYKIKAGHTYRVGKHQFQVLIIKDKKDIQNNLEKSKIKKQPIQQKVDEYYQKVEGLQIAKNSEQIVYQLKQYQGFCRLCLKNQNLYTDNNDVLIIPCKCTNFSQKVHIKCLESKFKKNSIFHYSDNGRITFQLFDHKCEKCQVIYPKCIVTLKNKIKKLNQLQCMSFPRNIPIIVISKDNAWHCLVLDYYQSKFIHFPPIVSGKKSITSGSFQSIVKGFLSSEPKFKIIDLYDKPRQDIDCSIQLVQDGFYISSHRQTLMLIDEDFIIEGQMELKGDDYSLKFKIEERQM